MALSPTMFAALEEAEKKQLSPWDYGAATISALKKRAWVSPITTVQNGRRVSTLYELTGAGKDALAAIRAGGEP